MLIICSTRFQTLNLTERVAKKCKCRLPKDVHRVILYWGTAPFILRLPHCIAAVEVDHTLAQCWAARGRAD